MIEMWNMELNEFLEKFLPDYEQKEIDAKITRISERVFFIEKIFPEALQNFADHICEKQKSICADAVEVDCGSWDGWGDKPYFNYEDVLEAEQPKIDEL